MRGPQDVYDVIMKVVQKVHQEDTYVNVWEENADKFSSDLYFRTRAFSSNESCATRLLISDTSWCF